MRGLMSFLAPGSVSLLRFGASGALPVFGYGMWWTVLTAGWLHGSALHILMNMLWVRDLAPATANLYGPGRTILIYVAAGVSGLSGLAVRSTWKVVSSPDWNTWLMKPAAT